MKRTLWIQVGKDSVTLCTGPDMPKELQGGFYSMLMYERATSRKEFERWTGVKLPKGAGHILGLEMKFGIIARKRVVTEKVMVAAEHTRQHVVDGDA